MRSSFFGLNVAITGLYSAQRSLDTVNHNLSNVNTPGYSRQQGVQQACRALPLNDGTGMIGTGSEVITTQRIHDDYLDFKYWSESNTYGEWQVKSDMLEEVERTFNEPSANGSGFNKVLDDFFSSVDKLASDPSSSSSRKVVISRGIAIANYFNTTATHFDKLQSDVNSSISLKVDEINGLAVQIQQLNRQIYTYEVDGNNANDLRDKRNVLVDRLSKIVNVQANEVVTGKLPNGKDDVHFVITLSGKALVDHFNSSLLKVEQRTTKKNVEDIPNLYDIKWADNNSLTIKGGELKGYMDIRDGTGTDSYKGIPFYMKKLNEFVRKFALALNEGITADSSGVYSKTISGHADGFGLQKPGTDKNPTGIRLFTIKDIASATGKNIELDSKDFINGATTPADIANRYLSQMNAKNFSISGDLVNQEFGQYNIAASVASGLPEDNSNLLKMMETRHNAHLFGEGAPEDFMKSLVTTLGIDSQQAIQTTKTQNNITKQIDNRRTSVSGVSIDEEMANMVKFQHAYSAAAKMISTMAEVYDTLINRVGISGR